MTGNLAVKNQEEMIENKSLREQHLGRVEVLGRVGELLMLPHTEIATTRQVADFYGVPSKTIESVTKRHNYELSFNGMVRMKFSDIKEAIKEEKANSLIMKELEITPKSLGISPNGSVVFTRRAILNVGMLLRDSEIAIEVRNQLLNIEESATKEHKMSAISKEFHDMGYNNFQMRHNETNGAIKMISNQIDLSLEENKNLAKPLEIIKKNNEDMYKEFHNNDLRKRIETIVEENSSSLTYGLNKTKLFKEYNKSFKTNVHDQCDEHNDYHNTDMTLMDFIEMTGGLEKLYKLALRLFVGK